MTIFRKYLVLFFTGGGLYVGIEFLWRGHSHWTMGILGGLCFICCGLLNELFGWDTPMWEQMLVSSLIITALEFIAGYILNIVLQLQIWDYSQMPFQIAGQICLPYTVLWFFLSAFAIILDDYMRYCFFNEEQPRYRLF